MENLRKGNLLAKIPFESVVSSFESSESFKAFYATYDLR